MKVKKNKIFKSKLQMVVYLFLMILILVLFVIIGTHDFNKNITTEAEQFNLIYTEVPKENVYVFGNATDVNSIINGKNNSGIIFFGFPLNKWSHYYAKYINEVAEEYQIKDIIYYDFYDDRKELNGTYETIVNSLSTYTTFNDMNRADIFAPTLVVVKMGKVIAYLDETALREGNYTPEIYWNQNQIETFKNKLELVFREYLS